MTRIPPPPLPDDVPPQPAEAGGSGRFARDTAVYMIATAANAALPVILLPILTRVLTPADYGIVAMFAVVVNIVSAFTGLSMHGAISVRFFKVKPETLNRFVTACLITLVATTALALLVMAIASPLVFRLTGVPGAWPLVAVLVSSLQAIGLMRLTLWQVERQPVRFVSFQIGQTLLNLTASLVLVLVIGLGWHGRLLGQFVALALFALLALALFWRSGRIVRPWDYRNSLRQILRFGVPIIPHVIGAVMIAGIDRVIVASVISVAAAGIYLVGLQVASALGLLVDAFNKVYSPWLMAHLAKGGERDAERIVRGTYVYFVVVVALALLLGWAAPFIVSILAGKAFQGASSVIIYLALGSAFVGGYYMVTNYIFFAGRTEFLALVTISCGFAGVAITYELVRLNGIMGAAQAYAITQGLMFVATWALAQKVHPMPWLRALRPA